MSQFAHDPETGQAYIWKNNGWQPATALEQTFGRAGKSGQALSAVIGANPLMAFTEAGQAAAAVNPVSTYLGAGLAMGAGLAPMAVSRVGSRIAAGVAARTEAGAVARQGSLRTSQGFIRNAEEVLPQSAQGGGRIVRAAVETNPVTRVVTDYLVRNPNQRNMNRLAARAIGVTDDEFKRAGGKLTDDLVGMGDARIGAQFDEVGARITANVDNDQVTQLALELAQENRLSNAKLAAIADNTEEAGRNLMSIRSQLQKQWRAEKDYQLRTAIENRIDQIDDIIESAIGDDGVTKRLYADARARYRASLALDKGAARSADDNINVSSLNTALKQLYGAGVTKGKLPAGAPDDVLNFIKGAREARGVNVGVPSSGTAERLIAANMLGIGTGGAIF